MEQSNGKIRSPRRAKKQILELLDKYENTPGMSVRAFCKLHQTSEGAFYSARKRYRSASASLPKKPGFAFLGQPVMKESPNSLFAELKGIRIYQVVSAQYLKVLIS
jgi:hypothetical protein